jgi:hypothetical protein
MKKDKKYKYLFYQHFYFSFLLALNLLPLGEWSKYTYAKRLIAAGKIAINAVHYLVV